MKARNLVRSHIKSINNEKVYPFLTALYSNFNVDVPNRIPLRYKSLSWGDAKDPVSMGHSIAAHTCTHRILSMLTGETAEDEIIRSINRVRDKVDVASKVFAYPTGRDGDFTIRDESVVANAGILAAVSTIAATCTAEYAKNNIYIHFQDMDCQIH